MAHHTDKATLVISSRNYSSWSLRGWLLVRLSGLECDVRSVEAGDARAAPSYCCKPHPFAFRIWSMTG